MHTSWMKWPVIAIITVLLAGCGSPSTPANVRGASGTEPVPILALQSGSNAAFKADAYLINAPGDTAADLSGLNPNYETQSVVVIALGEMPSAGHEVKITGVQKKGYTLFVQFQVTHPPADGVAATVLTHPYGAALIPKFVGNVSPEEEVQ